MTPPTLAEQIQKGIDDIGYDTQLVTMQVLVNVYEHLKTQGFPNVLISTEHSDIDIELPDGKCIRLKVTRSN